MSVKPVAWMGESPGGSLLISKHQIDSYEWLDRKWKVSPLYSAPAPELAAKLERLATLILERDWDCPKEVVIEAHESVSLLARITPK